MTEWNALGYEKISALQQRMAAEVLASLDLRGAKRVLDVGCGNGKITAEIARGLPGAEVMGVDASSEMIAFAKEHFSGGEYPNLQFETVDARKITFPQQFDVVVSFNALHWVPEQEAALQAIYAVMSEGGSAQLRLVPRGSRKSLEDVLEETRLSERWSARFEGFHDPYLHLSADEYAALAEEVGFRVQGCDVADQSWDFGSRDGFFGFGSVTFVEWTRRLTDAEKPKFIDDVLGRYSEVAGDDHTFRFYQMTIRLLKG